MKKKVLIEVFSSMLILLFLYTSISKWLDWKNFNYEIYNQPFPNWLTPIITWGVTIGMVALAVGLMFERTQLKALWGSLVLMLLFTVYIAAILLNLFHRIPCTCAGVFAKLNWTEHLLFNLFFVVITAIAILLKKNKRNDLVLPSKVAFW